MRHFAIFTLILVTSMGCNGNLLTGSTQTAGSKPYKAANSGDKISADSEMPTDLEEYLELSLSFFKEDIGDSEFTANGYSFANIETILSDALDLVQDRGLDVDITEENPLFESRSKDEISEFLSDFSLSYGEFAEDAPAPSFELQASDTVDAASRRFDKLFENEGTAERRFRLVETAAGRSITAAASTTQRNSASDAWAPKTKTKSTVEKLDDASAPVDIQQEAASAYTSVFQKNVSSFSQSSSYDSWFESGW